MTHQNPVRATLEADTFDEDAGVWTFYGTVIENDEVTNGSHGKKYWPAAALEEAAGSLTDRPVVDGHSYDDNGQPLNEAVEGKVTNDWYDPDTGWRYEMEVGDAELARKLNNNHLEVSFHGGGANAGETDDGAATMSNIYSRDLAIVPFGGARGNEVNAGPAPDSPASAAALSASLEGGDSQLVELDNASPDTDTGNEGAESSADDNDSMTDDDNPDTPDLDLDGRVVIDEERHAELTAAETELEDLQEENEELESELEAKDEQIDKVKGIYAAKLAELSGFSEEFFEDKDIDVLESELSNQLDVDEEEAAEAALSGMAMPQTGDGGGESVTATLSGLDDEEREEIAHLANRADMLDSVDAEYAAELREQAADMAGADEFAELEEVL
ncbi:hypothetical protein [Natrialba taiwanensis]|uniref:Uncharacterized protein n=1 Tax=Natrialba taiwanensis DSM 12281 TaxID=1230458 RepID=M0A0V6_9EURY|nr:hypothetical protein [Natrialba taiwanensis]ELY91467.1 hypothetical protein C484_10581 [Natrialba taiwanensis DSM 12281]